MPLNTVTIVGIAASTFTAVSMLPQLIKIIKEKEAKEVSVLMIAVLFAGIAGWIAYGILIKDLIIVISNSVSAVINALLTFFTLRYKKGAKG